MELDFVRSKFEPHGVIVYPLGEKLASSPLLMACDCRVVFDRQDQM
jgi:hypothetical protein